jgi:hypothetical protein
MASYHAPAEWKEWLDWLAAGLHGRCRWRLPLLVTGLLFAGGRRVVASWLRAGGLSDHDQDFYYFLQSAGRRWHELGRRVLVLVLQRALRDQSRVLVAIDDSPTKRYGPKVEGAGIHHDPTPGPTGPAFCYGHIWVTLAVVVRHCRWGTIGLPIWSWLYVRQRAVPKFPEAYRWTFQTKLTLAADLVLSAVETLQSAGKQVWAVADGAYAKRPFVKPVMDLGVTLVGRLRKDAALRDLPPREKKTRRGRKRKYGLNRISLAKRAAIEQVFHDVKEVWGSGQQQVRNLWTNIAVWHLNLWMHTLVELWAWRRTPKQLTHRDDSPWDDPERRPSHADRRKALQAACLAEEFSCSMPHTPLPRKIRKLLKRLLRIAV